jgi:hypothetical protein
MLPQIRSAILTKGAPPTLYREFNLSFFSLVSIDEVVISQAVRQAGEEIHGDL